MKTILSKMDDTQAKKQLKRSAALAVVFSGISFIAFWWLGTVGLALGARALLLTWHKGNQGREGLTWYRLASGSAVIAGFTSLVYGLSQ